LRKKFKWQFKKQTRNVQTQKCPNILKSNLEDIFSFRGFEQLSSSIIWKVITRQSPSNKCNFSVFLHIIKTEILALKNVFYPPRTLKPGYGLPSSSCTIIAEEFVTSEST